MESRDDDPKSSIKPTEPDSGMIFIDGAPWMIRRCETCGIIPNEIGQLEHLFYVKCECQPQLTVINKPTAVIVWNNKQRAIGTSKRGSL
jgi:hypothetical protein